MEKLCNFVVKYLLRKIHEEAKSLAVSVNSVNTLRYHKHAYNAQRLILAVKKIEKFFINNK